MAISPSRSDSRSSKDICRMNEKHVPEAYPFWVLDEYLPHRKLPLWKLLLNTFRRTGRRFGESTLASDTPLLQCSHCGTWIMMLFTSIQLSECQMRSLS